MVKTTSTRLVRLIIQKSKSRYLTSVRSNIGSLQNSEINYWPVQLNSKYFSTTVNGSATNHSQYLNGSSSSPLPPAWKQTIDITGSATFPCEVPGPSTEVPSRSAQVQKLTESTADDPYDILIIGGGATGAGCAFDAATRHLGKNDTKPLRVACIERGDFGGETSSRSTKLIWAGIRYLATASAGLLNWKSLTRPIPAIQEFMGELQMVINCHRERRYMLEKQKHLCNWVPIAIPFSEWYVKPAPFNHPLFSLFPVLAPFILKFYDSLSSFTCPPSYIMSPKKAKEIFPQLRDRDIKYCAVFYEAQHNDARTNICIAMSAAEHGANIANYVEMVEIIRENDESDKAVGIKAKDRMTNETFEIYANKIIFAGGPFTDNMRRLEEKKAADETTTPKENFKPAISSAAGTHIVLPGYYCPNDMGLLDYNTSDGRFLFFLPWLKHTLVGTTDVKGAAKTSPNAPEDEVQWLLNECGKYLSSDLQVRRSDVLSAWRGWRPLATDPQAGPDDPVSRDHVISENPKTGIIFIAGGKWTTWREMAEEVIDKALGDVAKGTSNTLDLTLYGGKNYSPNLPIQLIQKHGLAEETAFHLARTYGSHSHDVCNVSNPTNTSWRRFGVPLTENDHDHYPYIEAEVIYACREYACTIEDILSRRTRLAFLNKDEALAAIPRVAQIMQSELNWSNEVTQEQIYAATEYMQTYGGRMPNKLGAQLRNATYKDVEDIFNAIDYDNNGFLERTEVGEVASILGFPMSEDELSQAFYEMDLNGNGRVNLEEFTIWWNNEDATYFHRHLSRELGICANDVTNLKHIGGGTFFG